MNRAGTKGVPLTLDSFLQEGLASGCIRLLKSPMASPVFFVKKKDGSLCLVQDYRSLNHCVENSVFSPIFLVKKHHDFSSTFSLKEDMKKVLNV